jgi:hypothetical protein
MKQKLLTAALIAASLAACAGPQSRIKKQQTLFDAYPPAVQQKIRDGQADVGFTKEQVTMALGRPDRTYTRKTAAAEQEVWAYGVSDGGPRLSLGFGMGFGGGAGMSAGGIGVETGAGPEGDDRARVRVVFQDGKVFSVESRRK